MFHDQPKRTHKSPLAPKELHLGNIIYRWLYNRELQGIGTKPEQVLEYLATFTDVSVLSVLGAALAQANYWHTEATEAVASVPDPEEQLDQHQERLADINSDVAVLIGETELLFTEMESARMDTDIAE